MESRHQGGVAEKGPQGLGILPQSGKGLRGQIALRLGDRGMEPAHGQLFQVVAAGGGVQKVARQSRVKDKALRRQPLRQEGPGKVLHLVGGLGDLRAEKGPEKVVVARETTGEEHRGLARRVGSPLHAQAPQLRQSQAGHRLRAAPPEGQELLRPLRRLHHFALTGAGQLPRGLRSRFRCRNLAQELVQELGELQPQKNIPQLRLCRLA